MVLIKKKWKYIYSIIGLVILIIVLQWTGPLRPVTNALANTLKPIAYGAQAVGSTVKNFFTTISGLGSLIEENNLLQLDNEKMQAQIASLIELEQENDNLRKQLGIVKKSSYDLVAAAVIGYGTENNAQTILINRGEADNIKTEQAVLSPAGLLVGKIIKVDPRQATVLLLTDQECKINAMLQQSRATGIVKGELGVGLRMETIPQDTKINQADIIITSGLGGKIPKGLVIGTVESFYPSNNTLFQEAVVKPAVIFHELELLFVIKDF